MRDKRNESIDPAIDAAYVAAADSLAREMLGVPSSRTTEAALDLLKRVDPERHAEITTHGDGSRYWRFDSCGDCDDPNCAEGDSTDVSEYVRSLEAVLHAATIDPFPSAEVRAALDTHWSNHATR